MDGRAAAAAAGIGLVRLGVVEALPDADVAARRIGAAVVSLPEFWADDPQIILARIIGPVVYHHELQSGDRRPLLQGADRGFLVVRMIVQLRQVDLERGMRLRGRQRTLQGPQIVEEFFIVGVLAVRVVRRLIDVLPVSEIVLAEGEGLGGGAGRGRRRRMLLVLVLLLRCTHIIFPLF